MKLNNPNYLNGLVSSASEIDASVVKIKKVFEENSNSSFSFIDKTVKGTLSEYIDTDVSLDFSKNFTLSFVFENKGNEASYKSYQVGVQEGTNYFKIGYYADTTTIFAYATYSVGGTNYSLTKTLLNTQKSVKIDFTNNTETKTIGLSINGEDFAYAAITSYGLINMPFKLGTVNKNGIPDGNGLNMSNFAIYPLSLNLSMLKNAYLYFLDRWLITAFLEKTTASYLKKEAYFNILNNIKFGDFKYKKSNQYIINMLNSSKTRAVVGDSISHGETTTKRDKKSYVNLIKNHMNNMNGTLNFGFETFPQSPCFYDGTLYHTGAFTGFAFDTKVGDYSLSGSCLTGASASQVTLTIPKINNQNTFKVNYVKHASANYTCSIYVNDILMGTDTVSSSPSRECTTGALYQLSGDNSVLKIVVTSGTASVFGITYYNNVLDPVINNYCQPSRQIYYLKNSIIDTLCAENRVIFWALGYNDRADIANQTTIYAFLDRLKEKVIANNCCVVFLDFCWLEKESNFIRSKFIELASELGEKGMYINFMDNIRVDGRIPDATYLTTTLGAWTESAHPNDIGHRLLFNIIKKEIKL